MWDVKEFKARPMLTMNRKRIIIIGGGFGGVKCAQSLTRELSAEQAEVVLFDSKNHLVFSPLLAEVVGSSINPLDVVVPLRQLLPKVFCRTEQIRKINLSLHDALPISRRTRLNTKRRTGRAREWPGINW